jgi:hypothetical protein
MKDLIYYAHSKLIYGTTREEKERAYLEKLFKVICPNRDMGERGSIDPYLDMVSQCSAVICSEYEKHIGRGVFSEVEHALKLGKRVLCIRGEPGEYILHPIQGIKIIDENDWRYFYGKIILMKIKAHSRRKISK